MHPTDSPAPAPRPAASAPKKPTKFLADLTQAMQAAAEAARAETLEQFQADAKAHIEPIHARTANEAADLRKSADDDVAAIREWSKAELARIREETDRRIAQRKADLEVELEEHAARIEQRIERVQAQVAVFEGEMDRFFERLLAEEDPAEFAAIAENLPEPPPFDDSTSSTDAAPPPASPRPMRSRPQAVAEAEAGRRDRRPSHRRDRAAEPARPSAGPSSRRRRRGCPGGQRRGAEGIRGPGRGRRGRGRDGRDEAAVTSSRRRGPAAADDRAGAAAEAERRRIRASRHSGLGPDLDAAEAEAAAAAAASTDDEIPTIDDDALAARLAGLVRGGTAAPARPAAPKAAATSQVVVVGLVSVASIASFKRHLGRMAGVQSVGVSSGPDGEFVFTVAHGPDVSLADAVPTLPGFQARVTDTGDGVVNVTAHDPEAEG